MNLVVKILWVDCRKQSIKGVLDMTHIALHQPVNAVVDAIDSVATVDTVPDEGAHSCIHATRWCSDVHHAQVEATLTNGSKD